MKVIYYYSFLFYTKILSDDEPHATVIFTLSFTLAISIIGIINIILAYLIDNDLNIYEMIGIFITILGINYWVFIRKGRAKEIIKEKPRFFNNHKISILVTILYFIITNSFLFWTPIYIRHILEIK